MCKNHTLGLTLVKPSIFAKATIDLSPIPGLTPAGQELIKRLACSGLSRPPLRRNLVRAFPWSQKMQRTFGWDDVRSDYRHALDLEANAAVLAYWKLMPQRHHPYGDSTLPAGTTIVVLTAQGGELHEVLPDNKLGQRCKDWPARYIVDGTTIRDRVAEQFATTLGLRHRIIRTSSLSARRAKNREALSGAMAVHLPRAIEASILHRVDRRPGATVAEIADEVPEFTIHVLMQLVSLGHLFIDLEAARLTTDDYERIRVYRNAEQLELAYAVRLAQAEIPVCSAQAMLELGTRVELKGELFTVTQHERDDVLLVSDRGRSIAHNRFALATLLAEGKARAFVPSDAIAQQGSDRLRKASTAERNYASARFLEVAYLMKYVGNLGNARRDGVLITARQARLLRQIQNTPPGTNPLVALLPDFSGRGSPRLAPEVQVQMDRLLTHAFATPLKRRKARAHYFGLLIAECEKLNLKCPSEETFRVNWNKKSKNYDVSAIFAEPDADAHTRSIRNLLEEGLQDAGFYGQLACIDSTQLPLVVCDSVTGEALGPVYLSVMVDVYSRCTLAFHLNFAPPSAATALALLQTCVERHGFLPQSIFCDNGPDLRAEAFIEVLKSNHNTEFYRPPLQPKFCGLVESLLGVAQHVLFKQMQGAIKAHQAFGRKATLPDGCWDIWSLHDVTADLFYQDLPSALHSEIGMRPADRRDKGLHCKMVSVVHSRDEFYKLTAEKLGRKTARVIPGRGITVRGLSYYTSDFDHLGTTRPKVEVLESPTDLSRVWVQSPETGRWVEAVCGFHSRMSQMDGSERRLFTSELLARKQAIGKASRRRLWCNTAVKIAEAEQRLAETLRRRPSAQPVAQVEDRVSSGAITGFPTETKEMSA
ncbi:MAG: hypothetical protein C0518_13650 [Opitutus sp.]|nr:hypothetical protein [Opitutus sp.]